MSWREESWLPSPKNSWEGRKLADQIQEEVSILLAGENAASLASEAIALGADRVYVASHSDYSEFNGDSYTHLINELCKKIRPSLCLMGQTDQGRDVAPRVAAQHITGA